MEYKMISKSNTKELGERVNKEIRIRAGCGGVYRYDSQGLCA